MKKSHRKAISALPVSIPRKIVNITEHVFTSISSFFMSAVIVVVALIILAIIALVVFVVFKLGNPF